MSAISPLPAIRVTVKVPATCANMGPGLDCLAMALDLFNTVTFEVSERFELMVEGEGRSELPLTKDNLIYHAFETFYQQTKEPVPCVQISCQNDIPVTRGLGSSAAAIVSGLLAANAFSTTPLSKGEILRLAASLEGHPDNVTAALVGGCVAVLYQGGAVFYCQIPIPAGLKAVAFIPDFRMSTSAGRQLLEEPYPLKDVLFNMNRVTLLVAALATDRLENLRIATQDRLHQPRRRKLFPHMDSIFDAALAAGALGVFLSGGGSSIIALTKEDEVKIGQAMAEKGAELGTKGRVALMNPVLQGAQISQELPNLAGSKTITTRP